MNGNQLERLRQEQLRQSMEQLATIKRELKSFPHLEVIEKIGQGSFGDIYKVWDSKLSKWAAMKFEKRDKRNKYSLLQKEAQIMEEVKGSRYFALLYESRISDIHSMQQSQSLQFQYNFLEMTFLGPNLESLKKRMGGKFSLRTVLLIANQMISGLEALHKKGIIHRDIKPENFVIGSEGEHHQIFVIDFGLSKYYIENDGRHIEQKQNKGLVGTARYTSVNSHLGLEQSRRDDLESVAYLLLYFIKSSLLWQNLQVKDKDERFKKIAQIKQTTSSEALCRGLPKAFFEFLSAVRALQFEQIPDYAKYKSFFSACYQQNYVTPEANSCFDWCPKNCPLFSKPTAAGITATPDKNTNQMKNILPNISINNVFADQDSKPAGTVYPNTSRDVNKLDKEINENENANDIVDFNIPQAGKNENIQHMKINLETTNNKNYDSQQISKLAFSTLAGPQVVIKSDTKLAPSPLAASTGNIFLNGQAINSNNYLTASKMLNVNLITSASSVANNLNLSARQDEDGDPQAPQSFANINNANTKPTGTHGSAMQYNSNQHENSKALLAMLDRHAATPVISNANINLETKSQDSTVSERLPGERNKRVPIFIAQENHHKNGILESKRLLIPIQGGEKEERKSSPIQGKPLRYEKSADNRGKQQQVSYLTLQPLLEGQALNRDNSQYVNNQSNEWNSEQDEKVDIKQIFQFNSSQNNQHQQL